MCAFVPVCARTFMYARLCVRVGGGCVCACVHAVCAPRVSVCASVTVFFAPVSVSVCICVCLCVHACIAS